jgi:hypothetical protein
MRWSDTDEIYVPKIGLADGLIQHLYSGCKRNFWRNWEIGLDFLKLFFMTEKEPRFVDILFSCRIGNIIAQLGKIRGQPVEPIRDFFNLSKKAEKTFGWIEFLTPSSLISESRQLKLCFILTQNRSQNKFNFNSVLMHSNVKSQRSKKDHYPYFTQNETTAARRSP